MKVLLTGGTGFVGAEVLKELNRRGDEVITISRSETTKEIASQVVIASLGRPDFISQLLDQVSSCDAIIHFAACIDYDNSNLDLTYTNCVGMQQLIEASAILGVRSFIYASSATVIGIPPTEEITEDTPASPQSAYHATKLFGEHLLALLPKSDFSACSLRITAPIGRDMPRNRILSTFVDRALNNLPIMLSGHGLRCQNYVDVRDIATAVSLCLDRKPSGVFNLGGANSISNKDLAYLCVDLTNSSSDILFEEKSIVEDAHKWEVSSHKAHAAFGYKPKFDVGDTVKSLRDYYENLGD